MPDQPQSTELPIEVIRKALLDALKPTGGRPKKVVACRFCGLPGGTRTIRRHTPSCPARPATSARNARVLTRDEMGRILAIPPTNL